MGLAGRFTSARAASAPLSSPTGPEFCRGGTKFVESVPLSMRFGRPGNRFLGNLFPDWPSGGSAGTERGESVPLSRNCGCSWDRFCPSPASRARFWGQKQGGLSPCRRFSGWQGRLAGTAEPARCPGCRIKLALPAGKAADLRAGCLSPPSGAGPAESAGKPRIDGTAFAPGHTLS